MSCSTTKPTNDLHPARTQISLGGSESSLCSQYIGKDPVLLHADSKDWSVWADAQADLSLCWALRSFCWFCHAAIQTKYLHWQGIFNCWKSQSQAFTWNWFKSSVYMSVNWPCVGTRRRCLQFMWRVCLYKFNKFETGQVSVNRHRKYHWNSGKITRCGQVWASHRRHCF